MGVVILESMVKHSDSVLLHSAPSASFSEIDAKGCSALMVFVSAKSIFDSLAKLKADLAVARSMLNELWLDSWLCFLVRARSLLSGEF